MRVETSANHGVLVTTSPCHRSQGSSFFEIALLILLAFRGVGKTCMTVILDLHQLHTRTYTHIRGIPKWHTLLTLLACRGVTVGKMSVILYPYVCVCCLLCADIYCSSSNAPWRVWMRMGDKESMYVCVCERECVCVHVICFLCR